MPNTTASLLYISWTVSDRITKFYRHIHAGLPYICTWYEVTNYFRSETTAKNSRKCLLKRLWVEFYCHGVLPPYQLMGFFFKKSYIYIYQFFSCYSLSGDSLWVFLLKSWKGNWQCACKSRYGRLSGDIHGSNWIQKLWIWWCSLVQIQSFFNSLYIVTSLTNCGSDESFGKSDFSWCRMIEVPWHTSCPFIWVGCMLLGCSQNEVITTMVIGPLDDLRSLIRCFIDSCMIVHCITSQLANVS